MRSSRSFLVAALIGLAALVPILFGRRESGARMGAVAAAVAVAAALVVTYLALGGASYAPAKTADPCAPREWRDPRGLQEVFGTDRSVRLDGAACELGVSREDVVLAFAGRESLERLAREPKSERRSWKSSRARASFARSTTPSARVRSTGMADDLLRGLARRLPLAELLDLLELLPAE